MTVLFAGAAMPAAVAFAVHTLTDGHQAAGRCFSILAAAAGVVLGVLT